MFRPPISKQREWLDCCFFPAAAVFLTANLLVFFEPILTFSYTRGKQIKPLKQTRLLHTNDRILEKLTSLALK